MGLVSSRMPLVGCLIFTFSPPFSSPNSEEAKSTTWLHPVTGEAVITGHRKTPGKRRLTAFISGENQCVRIARRNAINAAAEPQLWQNATRTMSARSRRVASHACSTPERAVFDNSHLLIYISEGLRGHSTLREVRLIDSCHLYGTR